MKKFLENTWWNSQRRSRKISKEEFQQECLEKILEEFMEVPQLEFLEDSLEELRDESRGQLLEFLQEF